jgi:hypothetical protein
MTEDYRATPRQWDDAEYYGNPDRQPCPIGAYACVLELRARVEALEARHQSGFAEITTSLHSYKIGEAEPIEDWGKGHTLVNPKPPSLKDQAKAELDRLIALIPTEGALAVAEPIRRALESLDG